MSIIGLSIKFYPFLKFTIIFVSMNMKKVALFINFFIHIMYHNNYQLIKISPKKRTLRHQFGILLL